MTFSNINNVCKTFVEGVRAAGYYPMIYTGLEEINNYISSEVLNSCDLWFAQWWKVPQYYGNNMGMWQYGGEQNFILTARAFRALALSTRIGAIRTTRL